MAWVVRFESEFEREFAVLPRSVQDEVLARAKLLQDQGPRLGRPYVDTLKGSKYANMKELRSTPPTAFGALPLHSIRSATQSC